MNYSQRVPDIGSGISFTVKNIPTSDNEHVGVVEASITHGNTTITDFGIADAKSIGSENVGSILDGARINAEQRLMQSIEPSHASPARQQPFPHQIEQRKAKAKGGGSKPATERQRDMIVDKCTNLGQVPDTICRELCGKSLQQLRGQDADVIIKHLINH